MENAVLMSEMNGLGQFREQFGCLTI